MSREDVEERVKQDAREFEDLHPAVTKFVSMRGSTPSSGEPISGPFPRGRICSLHIGETRAVTTWDEAEDVCWLLAYHPYHRSGDPNDAYNVFLALHARDDLLPTEDDYDCLFEADDWDDEDLHPELMEAGRQLMETARANPGSENFLTLSETGGHQVMCIDIVVIDGERAEEGWMGLTLPEEATLSDESVFSLVNALVPPGVTPTYVTKFKDRERRRGEIVYHWDFYGDMPEDGKSVF